VKPGKLKKSNDDSKAMFGYVSLFENMGDAVAFEKAALATEPKHLPPCAKTVKDGGSPSAIYWRWLAAMAEAWS
jgi:hypothetical protein